jgi:hypothetical protein
MSGAVTVSRVLSCFVNSLFDCVQTISLATKPGEMFVLFFA